MSLRSVSRLTLATIVVLGACGASRAELTVYPGYDTFKTVPAGTIFQGVNYMGVPLGTFNFGTGLVATGETDTIVHRLDTATGPPGGSVTIPIQLVALQLESVISVGGHFQFITL
jgi:hypothetical protein